MRAAVLHGREDIRIETLPERSLEKGEVRIRIEAALTCGTDLKVYRRGYHARMIVPPAVFGHELAGIVSEIHPATRGWNVGERIVAANSSPCGTCEPCLRGQQNLCDDLQFLNGAYAESIVLPARLVEKNLLRLQSGTAFCEAALTEPLACAVLGVEDLALRSGEELLVIGSGPIGLMFVALGRHLGCRVTVAGRGEARMNVAKRLGAAALIFVPAETQPIDWLKQQLVRTPDVVVEAVGKPELWESAVNVVRKGGRVNFFGGCPAGTAIRLDTGRLHYSSLTLLGSFHHTPKTFRRALELIETGVVRAADFIDGQCGLSELPALFREMTAGNRPVKTLVDPGR